MMRRNRKGRFVRQHKASRWERIVFASVIGGILLGITYDIVVHSDKSYVYAKEEVELEPVEVQIEVKIDWTDERIEQELRKVFHEDPETAIKIARCENGWSKARGYKVDIQSQHILSYGQERSFGIMQIHAPDWHETAVRLGYEKYQTDPGHNIAMARHIYDNAGKRWRDWTCYTKGLI